MSSAETFNTEKQEAKTHKIQDGLTGGQQEWKKETSIEK